MQKKEKQKEEIIIEESLETDFSATTKTEIKNSITENETQDENLEISQELAEEKLSEIISSQKPQKKKKSMIVNLILLLVNIVFMVFVVRGLMNNIGEQNFTEYIRSRGSNIWWLAGGLGCYILYILSQTFMFHALIKSITGQSRWGLSYDVGVLGKYYDNVTPFAVGGQPMQIVRLSQSGLSAGKATSIPLMKMIINSMSSTFLAVIFFIFGLPKMPLSGGLYDFLLVIFEILGIVGLIITVLAVFFIILISTGNLFTRSLISWIVKVGYKLKLVKNYRATLKKWLDQVSEYKSSMSYLLKNKWLLLKMILYSFLESLSLACIGFFVTMAFLETNTTGSVWMLLFICVVRYYLCSMAGSFIPLPGGTGLTEIAFIALFSLDVGNAIVWALLSWRILSYYMVLIHGFTHEVIKIAKNVSKNRKRIEN